MNAVARPDTLVSANDRTYARLQDNHPSMQKGEVATAEESLPSIRLQRVKAEDSKEGLHIPFLNVSVDMGQFLTQYNSLRTTCYVAQALFPIVTNYFQHRQDGNAGAMSLTDHRQAIVDQYNDTPVDVSNAVISNYLRAESTIFAGMAVSYGAMEVQKLMEDSKVALALEYDKPQDEVTLGDLMHSENPMVQSHFRLSCLKNAVRAVSGSGFAFNLEAGLVGIAVDIGLERTVFAAKTSYDKLKHVINHAQTNAHSGNAACEIMANDLQEVMQLMRENQGKVHVCQHDMLKLRDVTEMIADDVLKQVMSIEDMIAVMGGGIINPDDPNQSMENYQVFRSQKLQSPDVCHRILEQPSPPLPVAHAASPEIASPEVSQHRHEYRDKLMNDRANLNHFEPITYYR